MYYFSPAAYQKVLYFLKKNVEVGGFCITDGNIVTDFVVLKQESSSATFEFDKEGMEEYLNEMIKAGYSPNECFRVYLHTHPGNCPKPSGTDWDQFKELSEKYPWFAMLIIAKDHSKYGYIKLNQGPGVECEIDWDVDWEIPCEVVDFDELEATFKEKVEEKKWKNNWIGLPLNPNGKTANTGYPYKLPSAFQATESDFLSRERWASENHNYMNVKDELDDELDDDEIFENFLKNKSVKDMTDEEFEFYQRYTE